MNFRVLESIPLQSKEFYSNLHNGWSILPVRLLGHCLLRYVLNNDSFEWSILDGLSPKSTQIRWSSRHSDRAAAVIFACTLVRNRQGVLCGHRRNSLN